ncbi:MAG: response regulator [Flavobacteriales bacterium]|nr:Transcriptional regulatory protein YpdB [Flavobacteriales bacterium]MCC6578051.1 response regulator [Flavobacteriales bacterium]NUQ16195.1 response regulator [Flavobacteriales bacterium]
MNAVRILIVEDEPLIAEDLRGHLEELGYEVVGACDNALDAMAELAAGRPDLLLLDINLGDGADGVQLAERINAKHKLPFIFVTSHADKGTLERVKAVRPAGFIIKPFDENDLRTQIEIALARYANDVEVTVAPSDTQRDEIVIADSIFIRDKGRLVKLAIDDIQYAEADDNYVTLFTPTKKYVITSTLAAVEEKLKSPHLLRIHRSYLVDTRRITAVEEGHVRLGTLSLPVGKTHKAALMARIRTL